MGKKAIAQQASASAKASKNEKPLQSLTKVLKPKVYITDSSSFKQLVQELTGSEATTQPRAPKPEQVHEKVSVIEIKDQEGEISAAATTVLSMDSSFSSFELCDNIDQAFHLEDINQTTGLIPTADEMISTFQDDHMYSLSTNQQTNWLAFHSLESWLLDASDQPYSYHCFSNTQNNEQDHHLVSLFDDYDQLSGLI